MIKMLAHSLNSGHVNPKLPCSGSLPPPTPQKKKKKNQGIGSLEGLEGGKGGGTKTLLQAMRLDEVIRKVRSEVTATEVSVGMLI